MKYAQPLQTVPRVAPLCPVFGSCGGCSYQDFPYEEELRAKEELLRELLREGAGLAGGVFEPIVASPSPYHYRNRLDLAMHRTKTGQVSVGFMPESRFHVLDIETCAIAREEISAFLPELKREAALRLPSNYRTASLVVKTGDDRRTRWGGIGRRSLQLSPSDYLWTEVDGKRIHYSLDTFFQANLSILPLITRRVADLVPQGSVFFDLYSGVGLFGILMAGRASHVVMVEDYKPSALVARHNIAYHGLEARVTLVESKVEAALPRLLEEVSGRTRVLFIDPPRRGLSETAAQTIGGADAEALLYLSCNPETLARDLVFLAAAGWEARRVMPFDFFPKTRHLETLVYLKRGEVI